MSNRPGVKTSEFWVTLIAAGAALLNEFTGRPLDGEGMAAVFGPAAAYVFSRGISKIRSG